jgi:large subunit ribosomal protein L33
VLEVLSISETLKIATVCFNLPFQGLSPSINPKPQKPSTQNFHICVAEENGLRIFAALKTESPFAMAKKGNRVQVILECTEHKNSGVPGTSRYITTKNKKNTSERIELKKYNPILKRVTVHKEIK